MATDHLSRSRKTSMTSLAANPRRLFAILATAEMITWTLLLLGMLGKYALGLGGWGVRIGGSLHGFVFLAYCLVTVLVAVDQRWRLRRLALGLVSAVIPYATVPFERSARRVGLLADTWRLRGERPRGAADRLVAQAVQRPVPAGVLALLLVTAVFGGLLMLGPPTQWFS